MEPSYSTTGKLSNHQSTLPPQASHRGVTAESRPSGKLSNHQSTLPPASQVTPRIRHNNLMPSHGPAGSPRTTSPRRPTARLVVGVGGWVGIIFLGGSSIDQSALQPAEWV